SAEDEAFRQEVRTWLDQNLPQQWRHGGVGGYRDDAEEDIRRDWQRRLYDGGWLKLSWPVEAGGRGATPMMQAIYQEEITRARTDPEASPPHKGIGYFLIDLKQPGVEVRRIKQLTGGGEFSEIFLTDAEVEDRDLVGAPTDGWKIAMTTFGFERGGLGSAARF